MLTFWAGDNDKLHFAKQELFSQMNNLEISITGKGFFLINRKSLANVSFTWSMSKNAVTPDSHNAFIVFQMVSECCTYIAIFIQMSLTGRK